ncbi:MAG: methyltransferase domain-containing protein [Thermodesulfobacteriota bacterium]|nr:methyltransferase domain-containing protein [Thermodesulfobacteriota bacterium]MEE2975415.1 methyltransferase domain-containing protein [Thermodesulfobacteriota bacterium]
MKPKKLHFQDTFYSKIYKEYLYKGTRGLLFDINHKLMEYSVKPKENVNSLDIGGGALQHFPYMNKDQMRNYSVYDYEYLKEGFLSSDLVKNENDIQCNFFSIENNSELLSKKGTFSRIIASHVLEHLEKPEEAIIEWVELLSDDGIISISIPADPGLFWKIGQLISFNKFSKLNKCDYEEFEMWNARQHINSGQRITRIINYYFSKKQSYGFPAIYPSYNFNLFLFFQLRKSDFIYSRTEQ